MQDVRQCLSGQSITIIYKYKCVYTLYLLLYNIICIKYKYIIVMIYYMYTAAPRFAYPAREYVGTNKIIYYMTLTQGGETGARATLGKYYNNIEIYIQDVAPKRTSTVKCRRRVQCHAVYLLINIIINHQRAREKNDKIKNNILKFCNCVCVLHQSRTN